MDAMDQDCVLAFLSDPSNHGGVAPPIERRETHISVVVLAGMQAYKLKRAVQFPYLDFLTPQRRLAACERKLQLNPPAQAGLVKRWTRLTAIFASRATFCCPSRRS